MAAAARSLRLTGYLLAFAGLPAILLSGRMGLGERHLTDFRYQWHAGRDILAGVSPYHPSPDPAVPVTSDCVLWAPDCFVYPPPAAFLSAPFATLPFAVAGALWIALSIAALCLALRLAGLRDWRCYGIALASGPFLMSIEGGTMTPLLAFGLAVTWRYRDRRWLAAVALAAVIALKLFLWPLALWFVATRRSWTAVAAAAIAGVGTLAAWAAISFAGFLEYPALLGTVADVWGWRAYTPRTLGLAAGLPPSLAGVLSLAAGGGALAAMVALRADERRSFTFAVAAALLLTPIVWMHYFVLLLVPLAVARPRLSPVWALPVGMLFLPVMADGRAWVIALGLLLAGGMLAVALRGESRPRRVSVREDAVGRPPAIAS